MRRDPHQNRLWPCGSRVFTVVPVYVHKFVLYSCSKHMLLSVSDNMLANARTHPYFSASHDGSKIAVWRFSRCAKMREGFAGKCSVVLVGALFAFRNAWGVLSAPSL